MPYYYATALALFIVACGVDRQPHATPTNYAAPEESQGPLPKASPRAAASQRPATAEKRSPAAADPGSLTRVASNMVCMVNNQYMGREQIPVTLEGRTYFGCCPMCKGRLASDPSNRIANDPVTGKVVDKALAVTAKTDTDKVLYFENEQSFERFAKRERN